MFQAIQDLATFRDPFNSWLALFVAGGLVAGIATGFFKAR